MCCFWPKNPLERIWGYAKFFLYGRPAMVFSFNSQDLPLVGDSTDYANRHGFNWPSPLYGPDALSMLWRKVCNETARGEAVLPPAPEPKPEAEKETVTAGGRGS